MRPMRRLWIVGFSTMALAASLFAQGRDGRRPAAPGPDARVGAGGIRTSNPNILYPGSPSGGQPGSILTPGTPRSPGASALPATPGAATQVKPPAQGGPGRGRRHRGGRGYLPIYGYGYGGVYIDSGSGPNAVVQDAETTTSGSANVVTMPPQEPQRVPRSRVFDVRETADGEVTTRVLDHYPGEERQRPPAEYWLIALKGGLIYAADSFEERDETFRFRTLEAKEFVVPLAEVDVAFTERLNSDLGRDFNIR
jgi:hypothetical protein